MSPIVMWQITRIWKHGGYQYAEHCVYDTEQQARREFSSCQGWSHRVDNPHVVLAKRNWWPGKNGEEGHWSNAWDTVDAKHFEHETTPELAAVVHEKSSDDMADVSI